MRNKKIVIMFMSVVMLLMLVGCGSKEPSIIFPYSNLQWGMSQKEVIRTLGGNAKEYDTAGLEAILGYKDDLFAYSVEYSEPNRDGESDLTTYVNCTCPDNKFNLIQIRYQYDRYSFDKYMNKCNELYDYLYNQHGEPTKVVGSVKKGDLMVAIWEVGTDKIELTFNDLTSDIAPENVLKISFSHVLNE